MGEPSRRQLYSTRDKNREREIQVKKQSACFCRELQSDMLLEYFPKIQCVNIFFFLQFCTTKNLCSKVMNVCIS